MYDDYKKLKCILSRQLETIKISEKKRANNCLSSFGWVYGCCGGKNETLRCPCGKVFVIPFYFNDWSVSFIQIYLKLSFQMGRDPPDEEKIWTVLILEKITGGNLYIYIFKLNFFSNTFLCWY